MMPIISRTISKGWAIERLGPNRRSLFSILLARLLVFALFCTMPLFCGGQELPYRLLKRIQDCSDELRKLDGVTATVYLEHANTNDARPFRLTLKGPKGDRTIVVEKDGSFRLPELPEEQQKSATVVHSLKKGDLTIKFDFNLENTLPQPQPKENRTISELCSPMVERFKVFERVFIQLADFFPEFKDYPMAATGIVCKRERSVSGRVLLKNGDRTVASADLSQTGPVTWLFEEYDPKVHRIEFVDTKVEDVPRIFFASKYGASAAGSRNAIFFRKPAQGSEQAKKSLEKAGR